MVVFVLLLAWEVVFVRRRCLLRRMGLGVVDPEWYRMGLCLSFDDKSMVSGSDGVCRVMVLMDTPVANPGVCSM